MITKKIRTHSRMNVRVRQSEKNSNLESINAIEAETSHLDPVEEYYDWQEKVSIALVVSLDRVTELLAVLYQFDADYQPLEPREGEKGVLVDPPGPMPSIDPNSEVVTRALQLINPPEARSVVCRKEIASVISVLILLDRYFAGVPTAGQSRKELNNAIEALINANNAIRAMTRISQPLSYIVRQPFWNAVSKLLDQITAAMKLHKERIIVGHGHQSPNFAKINAANHAFKLISEFATKQPTKTVGGTYYELASLLYEAITNKPAVDLSRFCRKEIDRRAMLPA